MKYLDMTQMTCLNTLLSSPQNYRGCISGATGFLIQEPFMQIPSCRIFLLFRCFFSCL